MNRGPVVALAVVVVLVGTLAGVGVAVGSTAATTAESTAGPPAATASAAPALQQDIDPDDVLMEVAVAPDGDAAWRIEYRMQLETEEDEQAFEELQRNISSDPDPYVERFHDRMNTTADGAADATGREMAITNVSVFATREGLPQERGVVAYTFRWSNFAATDGDRLVVGDAIDGLFLDENTSLLVSWSDEYALVEASPAATDARDTAVTYDGPLNFAAGEPRIELAPEGATGGSDGGHLPALVVATVAVVFGLLLVGAVFVARRPIARLLGSDGGDGSETGDEDGPPDDGGGPAVAAEADDTDDGTGAGTDEQGATPPDSELLSNEEQVLRLIERRGGRMKQQAVAEELGWTDAKTSQVTKGLREAGELDGFRLGRENVLTLPDEETAAEAGEAADESDDDQR